MGFWAHSYPVEYLTMRDELLASGAHEEVHVWKPSGEGLSQYQLARRFLTAHIHRSAWLLQATLPAPPRTSFNRVLPIVVTSIHWIDGAGGQMQLLVTYLNHGVQ